VNKAILLWGANRINANADYRTAFEASGFNYGNILIGNAVRTFLTKYDVLTRPDVESPAEANERCSHVVMPAANWLWKNFDFGYIADFLEQTRLPVTIIGLGAQTDDRTMISPIHPNTMRLIRLISDRSASLGVRGFYTAEVLAANGIHNVEVVGCPSLFTNRCPAVKIDTTGLANPEKLSVNFSRHMIEHSYSGARLRSVENVVLRYAVKRDSLFVAQDELAELGLSAGENVDSSELTKYFNTFDPVAVVEFFKARTRHFLDAESWATFIKTRKLSLGTRLHGNVIALANGVPAMMIIHDSRTMEVCSLLAAPNVHLKEFPVGGNVEEFLGERIASASFGPFEASYAHLYRRFVTFLSRNGLDHNLPGA
jgi:Polysaccharide pyruvyl transferase